MHHCERAIQHIYTIKVVILALFLQAVLFDPPQGVYGSLLVARVRIGQMH